MRALTLKQPWASLVRDGIKSIELRSWSTSHRGVIAIHAGASWVRGWEGEDPPRTRRDVWPLGAIVALASLVDVRPARRTDRARACCDIAPGSFAWEIGAIQPLSYPVVCKGSLGLWVVPEALRVTIEDPNMWT